MLEGNNFSYKRSFNGMLFLLRRCIVAMLIIGVLIASVVKIGIVKFQVPTYSATSAIYIASASGSVINFSDLQVGSSIAADYTYLIKSRNFISEVKKQLGLGDEYTYSKIKNMIYIKNPTNTHVIEIRTVSTDGKLAADISNALAEVSATRISDITETSHPKVIEYAIAARVPNNSTTKAVLAAILAMLIFYSVSLMRFWADDTVRSPEDVESMFEINALGIINGAPDDKDKKYLNSYGYGYRSRRSRHGKNSSKNSAESDNKKD